MFEYNFKPTIAFRLPLGEYRRIAQLAERKGSNLSEAARLVVREGLEKIEKSEQDRNG